MIRADLITRWIFFWHMLENGARANENDQVCAVDLLSPISARAR